MHMIDKVQKSRSEDGTKNPKYFFIDIESTEHLPA